MSQRKIKRPNPPYLDKLIAMHEEGRFPPGAAYHVRVSHDDWCRLLNGIGDCNCNPALPAWLEFTK